MHIIWGYIWSLGFKLLDERQLWINVIFSLTFGHLLRGWKKAFVRSLANNIPYCHFFTFIVLLKHCLNENSQTWLELLIYVIQLNKNQYCYCHILCTRFVTDGWTEKFRPHRGGTYLLSKGKNNKTRADCQRIESHSSAHLFKVCLVDVLLFGGKHMSTAAVPPWIGGDCVLANCIPGNQAKSEWSKLSHFWCEHSTWFTHLFSYKTSNHLHKPGQHLTKNSELCDISSYK